MNIWRDPKAQIVLTANFLLVVGASVTFMAIPWLLIQQPQGKTILGYTNSLVTLVILLLLPYLGKLVDRNSRKAVVLIFLACGFAVNILVIAAMLLGGRVEVWELLTVFCYGSLGASVYYPAQFALNQEIFAHEQYEALSGAIEIQWQAGAMIAGAAGAFLISRVPLWAILAMDSLTYAVSFFLITRLAYHWSKPASSGGSALKLMWEGVCYLRQRPRLSIVMFATFLPFLSLMVANYLSPIFVRDTLRMGAEVYGGGEVGYAVGAIAAGLTIPFINGKIGLIPTLLFTIGTYTIAVALNPILPAAPVFILSFILQGWGNAGSRVARSILVLKSVPNDIIGRVNLFYGAIERLFRAALLALVTYILPGFGPNLSYFILAAICLVGWLLVVTCRDVRTYKVEPVSASSELYDFRRTHLD
ncbi:MAG TPA: MFS transporter [Chthoniobacterales bacterium]|nr:MFS transporter [Chthoniobacterales bacterium]